MKKLLLAFLLLLLCSGTATAQTLDEIDRMIADSQVAPAREALSRLLKEQPDNPDLLGRWGFVLLLESARLEDPVQAKAKRKEARDALQRARDLGSQDEMVIEFLKGLAPDGGEDTPVSRNPQAQQALDAAEEAFSAQRYEEAVSSYQKAASLDPEMYEAPLYEGDAWFRLGDLPKACLAYQKATLLRPNVETAYRYWGDALLKGGDADEALRQYVLAVVADPSSQYVWKRGLERWAEATGGSVTLPSVTPLSGVGEDGKSILVDGSSPEHSAPWLVYAMKKVLWRNEEFAKRYPGETYRPTLAEEAEALTAVAEVAEELSAQGELKLDEDLWLLVALKKDGLMEPFVFYSTGQESIISEYAAYRESHRADLARYLSTYVARRKGAPGPIKREDVG